MRSLLFILIFLHSLSLPARYDQFLYNKTLTYDEVIEAYKLLDAKYYNARLIESGITDCGKPLHLFLIGKTDDPERELESDKVRLLINNGIHPGEPDGIDASLYWAEELLMKGYKDLPENVLIGIIPVYNIDGSLNRSCCSRANQNGPEEYGFRGNARNLDLNRDFIKSDSRNARSFARLFHFFRPHVFVDTHVSNGADYQYTLTLITTQPDKLHPELGSYVREKMSPRLFSEMKDKNMEMIPYVNSLHQTPDNGIMDFLETPRFATGYAALFNVIGFTTETHMFKPFKDRVLSTYEFLKTIHSICNEDHEEIARRKKAADHFQFTGDYTPDYPLNFVCDTTKFREIDFHGYNAVFEKSELTGQTRLRYDRSSPFTKKIKYFDCYIPAKKIKIPYGYIIPFAWEPVIERLLDNNIRMYPFTNDTVLNLTVQYIEKYETAKSPYEGHYLHSGTETRTTEEEIKISAGDLFIPIEQPGWRYLVETMEPVSVDSWFSWNFFDAVLMQKEWFSSYIFEDYAIKYLEENKELKKELEAKKKEDPQFANDSFAQLYFIYKRSPYYENSHNRYPVYKVMVPVKVDR